jgi:squalene-hopene/tetraprenyl-beta-curcumene cyclase
MRSTAEARVVMERLLEALWAEYDPVKGHWTGELSSSALSTAVAAFALARVDPVRHAAQVRGGLAWVAAHQNADGGWGDTSDSPSNISTTVLCWAALTQAEAAAGDAKRAVAAAERWLTRAAGSVDPAAITAAVVRHYGNDRTFSTPILTMCALSGRFGEGPAAWSDIFQLPFELSVLPPALFRWLRLTVVSYAVPALVAIGLVRHRLGPRGNPLAATTRNLITPRALRLVRTMQPPNGGYEEATPLTAFVAMALTAAGLRDHPIVTKAVEFLVASVRPDGAWPIDTNLSTWVTVLAVQALTQVRGEDAIPSDRRAAIRAWLLAQQQAGPHPLTFGGDGGWGWSDQPGSMPDADDTCGVLIALRRLGSIDARATAAAARGIGWLLSLQNSDGGIPTFSRGWGRLPFDRSCPDITAHAIRAFLEWSAAMPPPLRRRMDAAARRAIAYLVRAQRADGSWVPLWFGNQYDTALENPVYGTAQVVMALSGLTNDSSVQSLPHHTFKGVIAGIPRPKGPVPCLANSSTGGFVIPSAARDLVGDSALVVALDRAVAFLSSARNTDGGWGGSRGCPSTVEETALAGNALLAAGSATDSAGLDWLEPVMRRGPSPTASPIGLYFAKLWYSERLYPLVFAVWALERAGHGTHE